MGNLLSGGITVYQVKEIFKTIQGEGHFTGTPSIFVRFTGCNMWSGYEKDRERDAERSGGHCPLWCDTDFTKEGSRRLSINQMLQEIKILAGNSIKHVVFTGGEPLLQLDSQLITRLNDSDFFVQVETNGTISIEDKFGSEPGPDWVTCSPKMPATQLDLKSCNELKLVVPDYTPDEYEYLASTAQVRYLQCEDGPRFEEAKSLAINYIYKHQGWKLSVQTHKVMELP